MRQLNKKYWPVQIKVFYDVDIIIDWCEDNLEKKQWYVYDRVENDQWVGTNEPECIIAFCDERFASFVRLKFGRNLMPASKR